jgi:hypothetical protein
MDSEERLDSVMTDLVGSATPTLAEEERAFRAVVRQAQRKLRYRRLAASAVAAGIVVAATATAIVADRDTSEMQRHPASSPTTTSTSTVVRSDGFRSAAVLAQELCPEDDFPTVLKPSEVTLREGEPPAMEAVECYGGGHEMGFVIRTYATQAALDAALAARQSFCGLVLVGQRWMVNGVTGDMIKTARARLGGRPARLGGRTAEAQGCRSPLPTAVPGWADPPFDVRRLGCAKGARAFVEVEVDGVVPGNIEFTVTDTGPTGHWTLFSAGGAVEGSRWGIPLEIPDGCPGHTQTITITHISATPSEGVVKRSAVELLTFTRQPDGVLVANVIANPLLVATSWRQVDKVKEPWRAAFAAIDSASTPDEAAQRVLPILRAARAAPTERVTARVVNGKAEALILIAWRGFADDSVSGIDVQIRVTGGTKGVEIIDAKSRSICARGTGTNLPACV